MAAEKAAAGLESAPGQGTSRGSWGTPPIHGADDAHPAVLLQGYNAQVAVTQRPADRRGPGSTAAQSPTARYSDDAAARDAAARLHAVTGHAGHVIADVLADAGNNSDAT